MQVPTTKQGLIINSASNTAHMVAKVAVMFFMTPFLVHGLGDTRYGIWVFANTVIAYLALGDFGVQTATIRFVAKYDGLSDTDQIRRVFMTSTAMLGCVGICILVAMSAFALFWQRPFDVSAELAGEAKWLLVLLGFMLAVSMSLGVAKAVLAGLGRYPALNGVRTLSLLLRNGLLIVAIACGGGLKAVGIVLLASCLNDVLLGIIVAKRCFPQLSFSLRYADSTTFRAIVGYGSNMFINSIAMLIISQCAVLVIAKYLAADAITYFSIGMSPKNQVLTAFVATIAVLTPAVSKWDASGERETMRRLFIATTRYGMYILAPIEIGLITLGYSFLTLWMGPTYADACFATLVITSVPLFLSAPHLLSARILEGIGTVRPLAIISVTQAVFTLLLSVYLVGVWGIEGVALAASIPLALSSLAVTILMCRQVNVRGMELFLRSFLIPSLASIAAGSIWILLQVWHPVESWLSFLAIGTVGMVPYLALVFSIEPECRRAFSRVVHRPRRFDTA